MPSRTLIVGNDSANTVAGGAGDDLIYGFDPNGPQGQVSAIAATRVAAGLSEPVFVGAPPGDYGRLFIVEKSGLIKILDLASGQILATPFLSVTGEIATVSESGLLGLAFDPDFVANGRFYVNLVNTSGDTEIRRYQMSAGNPDVADPASRVLIISIDQPSGLFNHKAGWLGFGPDGDLYAALGDGGGGGDPSRNGQNIDTLLGKILRLDVSGDDFPADPNRNYAIPADNPYVGTTGADEIWAIGLRNPWRNGFDRGLGDLYIADVGQGAWEEIDIGARGANYGWNVFEGPATYAGGPLTGGSAVAPIHAYDRSVGQAIIGGYVYRGPSEGLQGTYFFADAAAGKIFTLRFTGGQWVAQERTGQVVPDAGAINGPVSFGEDAVGHLYVVDFDGDIFRLTPAVVSADQGDTLSGGGGNDLIYGGSGGDWVDGGSGHDGILAGNGNDILFGGDGNDLLLGGSGDDALLAGVGSDHLDGGDGIDKAGYRWLAPGVANPTGVVVDLLDPSHNTGIAAGDSLTGIEIVYGSQSADQLVGDGNANTFHGDAGGDVLFGGAGDDVLRGEGGDDALLGGTGGDVLDGGAGIDKVGYRWLAPGVANPAAVTVDLADPAQNTGIAAGDSYSSIEIVYGSQAGDRLTGDGMTNVFHGDAGNDVIGGAGGNDTLVGEGGDDTLAGGSGDDRFVFRRGDGLDTITDFVAGNASGDLADLQGYGVTSFAGLQPFMSQVGPDTVINFDAGNRIVLQQVQLGNLNQSDFLLS
jgi:Ca2+-binding RTX toxin-like protein